MWRGIGVLGPYPSMKGYLICTFFAWFNPGLPNFANSFLRAVFTNQGVYILPKVLIANIADFGNVTIFSLAKVLHCCKNVLKRHTIAWHARLSVIHFLINCALCSLETLS